MELNKWEKEFKEQLNSREISPSENSWAKLDTMLSAVEKPKRKFHWMYVAASLVGLLLIGTVYFSRFDTVEINNDKPIVLEKKNKGNNLDEPEIINTGVLREQNQIKAAKKQTVVAYSFDPKKQINQLKKKEELPISSHLKEVNAIVNASENKNDQSAIKNKYISAEKLLAEVSDAKFETKITDETIEKSRKAVSVNPNDLLLNAENELNQSFRESALDRFNKKINAVKTVFVNRNYKE